MTGSALRTKPPFDRVATWIFDLDNCLYPASTGLFALIDERMGAYIQRLLGIEFGRGEAHPESSISAPTGQRLPG